MLLAAAGSIAVIALSAGGAQAQQWRHSNHRSARFVSQPGAYAQQGCRRGGCDGAPIGDWYGGEWARDNNRGWEATSYNDWWHEEPWRAYPAWMRRNQDCERRWFSGDVLRC
jgi:hypothetical protein